ncbi:MAG: nucleoside deaminase [bacterium]|nr:nucleoside deaminase [bacterium]
MNASIFGKQKDQFFMQLALAQAKRAFEKNEVPIGAIVVAPDGTIIARAFNRVEQKHTQRAHAEMLVLEKAAQKYGDWRLSGHWLYVTLEPCSMCMGLARLSRLAGVVYGADSPLFGYQLDNVEGLRVYNEDVLLTIKGVEATEAALLLKQFFQNKREKKGEWYKRKQPRSNKKNTFKA